MDGSGLKRGDLMRDRFAQPVYEDDCKSGFKSQEFDLAEKSVRIKSTISWHTPPSSFVRLCCGGTTSVNPFLILSKGLRYDDQVDALLFQ
jgi:hypothetical protein